MTKDRRLGRGLAALLGSPLDEDGVIEGVPSGSLSRGPVAGQSALANTPSSSTPPAMSTATSVSGPSVGRESASAPLPVGSSGNHQRVTGAVPLSAVTPAAVPDGNASIPTRESTESDSTRTLKLSVYEIDNNPFQPRRKFNEEEIASLAASIREHEQLQPILVRRVGDRYQLISGERRLRAAIHAGLKTIRAEVREADDRLVAELAIVENLQRKDLDAIEKALSFRRYIDQHQCSQEQLAKRLKIDRSTVTNMMRLLELPKQVQQWIQNEGITVGHAKALLSLGNERQQVEFGRQIQEESWSVRETERRVNVALAKEDADELSPTGGSANTGAKKRTSPQIAALEQQLRLSLGTKTEIRQNASGSGKITITFANNAEFERLCSLICPEMTKQRAA